MKLYHMLLIISFISCSIFSMEYNEEQMITIITGPTPATDDYFWCEEVLPSIYNSDNSSPVIIDEEKKTSHSFSPRQSASMVAQQLLSSNTVKMQKHSVSSPDSSNAILSVQMITVTPKQKTQLTLKKFLELAKWPCKICQKKNRLSDGEQ